MLKKYAISLLLCLGVSGLFPSFGQGCSDAGFCTINSFKPNSEDSTHRLIQQVKVGAFFGKADFDISVYGINLEYNRTLGKKWGFDLKLTTLAQNGNDISVSGLSDVFLNANYQVSKKIKVTMGSKLPLSKADKSLNKTGSPLPMDYQSSLGTIDLILGIGYEIKKIQLVAALQQPLTQNRNGFLASDVAAGSPLSSFPSTRKFERAGDVLLRVSYPWKVREKLTLTPSLLPIYHLTRDKFTDQNGLRQEIAGSQGLTLNGNIYLDYHVNKKNAWQLNVGVPFIVRDVRPDGLTRSIIANLEYRLKF